MAATTIRSTYAFDPETVERLERLAQRWHLSRSATLRKLVHDADQPSNAEQLAALDHLERLVKGRYSLAEVNQRLRAVRLERLASHKKRIEPLLRRKGQ